MGKKKGFWKPAAAGFAVMYLATMGLATGLVKERFAREDELQFERAASAILDQASEKEFSMEEEISAEQEVFDKQETLWSREKRRDFYQHLANHSLWQADSDYMQISIAVYDKDKSLLVKSRDEIGGNLVQEGNTILREYASFALDDYLLPEEKEILAQYEAEDIQYCMQGLDFAGKYRFSIRVSPDWEELWEVYVQEIIWEEGEEEEDCYHDPLTGSIHCLEIGGIIDYATGEEIGEGKVFYEVSQEVVWKWTNPAVDEEKMNKGKLINTSLSLPYLNLYQKGTFEKWKRWTSSSYLHDFTKQGEFVWEKGIEVPPLMMEEDALYRRGRMQIQVGRAGDPFAYLEIRMESRPWYAAVNYMKYVYLAGAALTVLCMLAVIGMMRRGYQRQAVLEETRRDFTNAMAHELKTPLGVIRNFAENLLEHHKEEKRDYYLLQIIGQTEEMDRLVAEMIEVSKLDSEELVLGKEEVSLINLLQEQTERLAPSIAEKKLQVEFQVKPGEDFLVLGDREYLAKAVWNLLVNAVDYNLEGGRILIWADRDGCVIENSGKPMEEEILLHAFDLFYTSDKNRTGREGHRGLGLYLAKKILKLHGLKLTLHNVDCGVRVVVKKNTL